MPPKEPRAFKYPRVYYTDDGTGTIRILYPDGRSERMINHLDAVFGENGPVAPCWAPGYAFGKKHTYGKHVTSKLALKVMREYDAIYGRVPEFVMEIK